MSDIGALKKLKSIHDALLEEWVSTGCPMTGERAERIGEETDLRNSIKALGEQWDDFDEFHLGACGSIFNIPLPRCIRYHTLKTWPGPYEAMVEGFKNFEFREDDRGFEVGDILNLVWWKPGVGHGTGKRWTQVEVMYLIKGPEFGIPVGSVCMSVKASMLPRHGVFPAELNDLNWEPKRDWPKQERKK